ncbi:T9SS type A sorting domain-containing protein [Flavobacterium sp. Sd200]|uniref:T9SS type A sorting domain-containing protein n=1 Tax=Flavobacterium sp. Sd200 TaxID=2692211 RepID=UPI00136AF298|nr:T9SS type A sorting domain-containing protein [Flavobacterium sp. Sd200]MXN91448.1 T9SS type A sorting domain-containing protein [Flavobacterium sp. Sd200]
MKKTLLTALFALSGICANAQLPNGSIAPDFTAVDINGVEHHLYDYLEAGKTVIIDISATWCGPCWNYHGTNALYDLYHSYGPGGSDEVVVLFIEGDPSTSLESIYGTNTPEDTSVTRGDWTHHSPYPIINDPDLDNNRRGDISQAYALSYFPTVYMICPETRTTTELTQPAAAILKTRINAACVSQPMAGVNDKPSFMADPASFCQADGVYKARVKNLGTNRLTNATVVLKEGDNVLSTKTYTSTTGLPQYSTTLITFDSATFTAGTNHTVEVTSVNNLSTFPNNQLATEEVSITPFSAAETDNEFEVRIYTDFYAGEISWRIRNSANAIVATGGPFQAGDEDQYGGGGPDANTVISQFVSLPDANECYKIELRDSFGDGWDAAASEGELHGIEVYNGNDMIYSNYVSGSFTTVSLDAALSTTATMGHDNAFAKQFTAYPNPTKGILNFSTAETVDVTIVDVTGKTVYTAKGINDGDSINLSSLQKGMYIAQIKGVTSQKTEKIIIE